MVVARLPFHSLVGTIAPLEVTPSHDFRNQDRLEDQAYIKYFYKSISDQPSLLHYCVYHYIYTCNSTRIMPNKPKSGSKAFKATRPKPKTNTVTGKAKGKAKAPSPSPSPSLSEGASSSSTLSKLGAEPPSADARLEPSTPSQKMEQMWRDIAKAVCSHCIPLGLSDVNCQLTN